MSFTVLLKPQAECGLPRLFAAIGKTTTIDPNRERTNVDLILLRPGDTDIFPSASASGWNPGGSLIDSTVWRAGPSLDLGQCIELVSIHQGMKQPVNADASDAARTPGRPVVTEFTCVKYVDKTSVKLYDYCLRGQPIGAGKDKPSFIYMLRNSGDKTANIITFALRDALITEIQLQSHPDDMPTEQFKLNFTEILWTFNVQSADLRALAEVTTGWSLTRNQPISEFN